MDILIITNLETQTLTSKVDHFNEKNIMWCTPCIEGKQHINKFPKEAAYKSKLFQILILVTKFWGAGHMGDFA